MSLDSLNLRQLQAFENDIPLLAGFPSRILAETYDDFINVLYEDIDRIIYRIQENPELRQSDNEDRLTIDIQNQLRSIGYDASHDSKIGGHADLVVRKGKFLWIGEAKIHRTYEYLWEGFQQLNTRYSTGDSNQKDGGILIYIIHQEDAKQIVWRWQEHLSSKKLPDYACNPCGMRDICFFSIHKHEGSGYVFRIRHMPVILYFKPRDKSARARKTL
jgi:hypothetical protein